MKVRRTKRSAFLAHKGFFISGGISKRYSSPYLTAGYKRGRYKFKTSIGRLGHKGSATARLSRRTSLTLQRNFTTRQNSAYIRHRNRRFRIR